MLTNDIVSFEQLDPGVNSPSGGLALRLWHFRGIFTFFYVGKVLPLE